MARRKKTIWVKRGTGRRSMNGRGRPTRRGPPRPCPRPPEPVREWVPVEIWRQRGWETSEMTLPLDVPIPIMGDGDWRAMLRPGMRVIGLRNHTGCYMQLDDGKIVQVVSRRSPAGVSGGQPMVEPAGGMINRPSIVNHSVNPLEGQRDVAIPNMDDERVVFRPGMRVIHEGLGMQFDDDRLWRITNEPSPTGVGGSRLMEGAGEMNTRPTVVNRTVNPLDGQRDTTISQLFNGSVRPDDGARDTVALGRPMPNTSNTTRWYLRLTFRNSTMIVCICGIILLMGMIFLSP